MQAVVGTRYGPARGLRVEDVPDPVPADDEVVVSVRAASVNAGDWRIMRGEPWLARPMMGGLRGPNPPVRGWDYAGVVVSVGGAVTDVAVGDEVFGSSTATFAELAAANAERAAPKPPGLSFEDAAALPVAGVTALQALRRAEVEPGRRVLVNGAAGGVGTFAVQIAKARGAEVTGVCSGGNADFVRGLGADRVVDYGSEDFTRQGTRYDAVLDCVGNRSIRALRRALAPHGTLVAIGGGSGKLLGPLRLLAAATIVDRFVGQRLIAFLARTTRADLLELASLVESGRVRPAVDRTVSLAQAADAIAYVESHHARGKVVVTIRDTGRQRIGAGTALGSP
jgi:NADPH:quinone reductase-like Zn-dependent oxidoreductase